MKKYKHKINGKIYTHKNAYEYVYTLNHEIIFKNFINNKNKNKSIIDFLCILEHDGHKTFLAPVKEEWLEYLDREIEKVLSLYFEEIEDINENEK